MTIVNEIKADYFDLWLNIRFEFLKNWKRSRTLVAMGVSVLTSMIFFIIPKITSTDFPEESFEFLANSMGFVYMILILNAILFGADAINGEHYNKSVLLIYPLPQRRMTIIVGKYISQLITSWLVVSLYYGVVALEVWNVYGIDAITEDFLKSLLFSFLYMAVLMAFSFMMSALVKSPAISMVLVFFSILLLFPIIIMMFIFADIETSFIFTNYSTMITKIFRFPSEFSLAGVQTDANLTPEFNEGVIVCFISLLVFIMTAIGFELRREV
ncbi:MAG: ABC transporter permease [Candidatus Kariarchaeaceae archaeon]|jgi:ABC-type transport system involved in multi-copper enzyme maturation permease subunit